MKHCTIIGISDKHELWFAPDVLSAIGSGTVFSGGKRHHEIVQSLLPAGSSWIDITVPLSAVFSVYERYDDIVVFASGDPLFYGFAATVQRECPDCKIVVYPYFNSLQMLAHRMCLPYQDMCVVSLTGRSWDMLDEALISGKPLIGVLTDRHKTPEAIRKRMVEYGYGNYRITVGENLGNEHGECVETLVEGKEYAVPNCMILQKTSDRHRPFGIPEKEFHLLSGRVNMITKMPVRLLSLSLLDLHGKRSFWDVGFCTGSVSIEARLQFPHLHVTSFEVREEGRELMLCNARKFGTPGIDAVIGDFLQQDLSQYPAPDAVFIGGHGGRLKDMVARLRPVIMPGGCIVFNSVSEDSKRLFEESVEAVGMSVVSDTLVAIDSHNPIHVMKAQ